MAAKFRTQYNRVRVVSPAGSPMVNDYISVYDNDGKRHLEINGQYHMFLISKTDNLQGEYKIMNLLSDNHVQNF